MAVETKTCLHCKNPMPPGKRPHAVYCNSSKRARTIMEWRLNRSVRRGLRDAA